MFFHLNEDYTISFLDHEKDGSITIGTIRWPYLYNHKTLKLFVTIDHTVHEINGESQRWPASKNFSERDLAILRSQLQKCARRKKRRIGVETATTMVGIYQQKFPKQIGLFEMLRRLTIIIIEDCVFLREYGELVWYICALSKGFEMGKFLVERALTICDKVMMDCWKDKSYRFEKNDNIKEKIFFDIIKSKELSEKDRNLLLALQLRNSFHGMPCDVEMLNQSSSLWLTRLEKRSPLLIHLDRESIKKNISFVELERDQIQLEALDHHCTNIVDRIIEIFPIEKEELESMIWDFRSSINKRIDIEFQKNKDLYDQKPNKDQWLIIKPIVKIQAMTIKEELSGYSFFIN